MQAAHRIPSAEPRFEALVAQVPQLVGEALARGLQAVVDFEDEEYRAMVAAFLYSAPDPEAVLRAARKATADCLLNRLSAVRREVVLKFCADRKVFAPPFLDQDTLATIAGHIVEVCEKWKWM